MLVKELLYKNLDLPFPSLMIDGVKHIQIADIQSYNDYDEDIDSCRFDLHYNDLLHNDLMYGLYSERVVSSVELLLHPDNVHYEYIDCCDNLRLDFDNPDREEELFHFEIRIKPTLRIFI